MAYLDPEAVILTGRLHYGVRCALAERAAFPPRSFAGISANPPKLLVDPNRRCLEAGAAALPTSAFLFDHG